MESFGNSLGRLTVDSGDEADTISCRALTESACSNTKEQTEISGGTSYKSTPKKIKYLSKFQREL